MKGKIVVRNVREVRASDHSLDAQQLKTCVSSLQGMLLHNAGICE